MERIKKDLTAKIENKLKKKVESMYKGNLITKEMKGYLIPKGSRPGKVQGNPKMHKKNNPCRVIINGNKHSTENMAEIVENELAENVLNLNSYIKDTTDFLCKLSKIQQPLPKVQSCSVLMSRPYIQVYRAKKQEPRAKQPYRDVPINH
jgi:hypothetical protein